jgi:hypothetical protein
MFTARADFIKITGATFALCRARGAIEPGRGKELVREILTKRGLQSEKLLLCNRSKPFIDPNYPPQISNLSWA